MNPQPGFDPTFSSAMRGVSRGHIAEIWRQGQSGEALSGEDRLFYDAMKDHPEYFEFWERAAELLDRDVMVDGVNPFLHVSMHAVIAKQIADSNPVETAQSIFRLTRAGIDPHQAVHRVIEVFAEMLMESLHKSRAFSANTYRRRLRALEP